MLSVAASLSPAFPSEPGFSRLASPWAWAGPHVNLRPPQAVSSSASRSAEGSPQAYSHLSPLSKASPYEILGIPSHATCQEIKAAYRRLARTCHPDVAAVHRKDSSTDEFRKIHAAYSTLCDPEKRADYDRRLFRRYRPLTAARSASGLSGYSRRTWETDQCW